MRFIVKATPEAEFESWVGQARVSGSALDAVSFAELAKPSQGVPPMTYRAVDPKLFQQIIDQTVLGSNKQSASSAWCPPVLRGGG
jgi:cytochrome o ubiquinol oxidase subunit II